MEIPDDRNDLLSDLSLQDNDELLATRDIGDYWTEKPPKKHINVIVKLPCKCLTQNLFCTSVIMRVCTLQNERTSLDLDKPCLLDKPFLDEKEKK